MRRSPAANQFEERHMAEHEKEVIVTDGGGGGGGGAIIAVVLLVVVLVVLFLVFGTNFMRGNNPTDINADIKVETPKTN
jgi:predicted metalloprotease